MGLDVGECLSIGKTHQRDSTHSVMALLQQPLPVYEGQMGEAGSDSGRDRCPIPLQIRLHYCADWGLFPSLRRASQVDRTLGRS